MINLNLNSLFILCQSAGRHMIPRKRGKIISVASLVSFIGGFRVASYAASKGAVTQLTKALSNEWSKYIINVNAIAPVATDMLVVFGSYQRRERDPRCVRRAEERRGRGGEGSRMVGRGVGGAGERGKELKVEEEIGYQLTGPAETRRRGRTRSL